jgi:hypothetical protein
LDDSVADSPAPQPIKLDVQALVAPQPANIPIKFYIPKNNNSVNKLIDVFIKDLVSTLKVMIKNNVKDSYEINDCNDLGKVVLLAEEINREGIRGVLGINNFFKRGFDDAIQDGVKLT